MRIILKIIAAPFVLALMLIVAVLSFLSCIAGAVCWLACTVFVLLDVYKRQFYDPAGPGPK